MENRGGFRGGNDGEFAGYAWHTVLLALWENRNGVWPYQGQKSERLKFGGNHQLLRRRMVDSEGCRGGNDGE